MGALPRLQLPTHPPPPPTQPPPTRPTHPPPTCPPPLESIRDITGAEKTSSIQVACRNSYKMLAI